MKIKPLTYNIDIVGTCNLRCPSCPIGNISHLAFQRGAMQVEMLREIVRKAKSHSRFTIIHLYNWTEPFLHPKIGDCIRAVHAEGAPVCLSTNLNIAKRIDEVAEARPDKIRISLSGFQQETYGTTHARGDIEAVKANMKALSGAVARNGSKTELSVLFHRYLDNQEDEHLMRDYATALGYRFEPVWAYMMPLEKNLAYAEEGPDAMTNQDKTILAKLALPMDRAIDAARETPIRHCELRDRKFAIGPDGGVYVCCATYEQPPIGSFLDDDIDDLQKRKYEQEICTRCMAHGLHDLSTYHSAEEYDRIAVEHIQEHSPDYVVPGGALGSSIKAFAHKVRMASRFFV